MRVRSLLALLIGLCATRGLAQPEGLADAPDAGAADAGAPAQAWDIGELDLEALLEQDVRTVKVVAASKREETVGDAPATITVITAQDFARHDWRTVAEALRAVPGVYVSSGRDYFRTGVRGLSFPGDLDTRLLVLIDGHPMNNPWNAASNLGELLSLPPAAIDRVEVVRGPASSVYGSNAFLAVVNIVSRGASEKVPTRAWAQALASTLDAYRVSLGGHHRTALGLEVSGFATLLTGDGPSVRFEDMTRPRLNLGAPTPTQGLTRGTDFERGASAGLTVAFKGVSLTGQVRTRNKGLPGAPGGALFDDAFNAVADRHLMVEAKYGATFGIVTLSLRAGWDQFENRRTLHLDPTDWEPGTWKHGDVRIESLGNAQKWSGEAQAALRVHARDTLTFGVELASTTVTQPTYEIDPDTGVADPGTIAGGTKDARGALLPINPLNVGAYLQNDWRPLDVLGVVVGVRYDYNTVFTQASAPAAALAPRASLVYKPLDAATLKLSYGEAFRYPTPYEAFFDDLGSVCGNSKARPERQRTVELGGTVNFLKGYNLSVSGYWSQLQDLLVRQRVDACYAGSGPRQQFVNAGTVMVLGGEVAFDVRLPGLTAFVNGGANHAVQTLSQVSSRPANSPTVVAGAGVAVPLLEERVWASARAHFTSSRLTWTLDQARPVPAALRLEASLTGKKLLGPLTAGLTAATAFRVFEVDARFQDAAVRDPVTGAEVVSSSIPQNLVEVRAHVGFEL